MVTTVKELAETKNLTSLPSIYAYQNPEVDDMEVITDNTSLPVIDYSKLISENPSERSQGIDELRIACRDWGFFILINHGVPESLQEEVLKMGRKFFELGSEDKSDYVDKDVLEPIRCGTSYNTKAEKVHLWRDFLKVFVHPVFHCPSKPQGFSEILHEYSKKTREVSMVLFRAISLSLGLEEDNLEKALGLNSGLQVVVTNLYPPCPQPELAMGLPPHSDHGLLTLVIEDEVGGLQVMHKGKWIAVNFLPNSFIVNSGDHMEIWSNGKYKSIIHRVLVKKNVTRMSLALVNGPSLDTIVAPAPELVDEKNPATAYVAMKYKDSLERQQGGQLVEKACLNDMHVTNVQ